MPVQAMTDCRIWIDAYDLSSTTNDMAAGIEVAELETTNFDSGGWRQRIGGLRDVTYDVKGMLDFADDASEEALNAVLGASGKVVTFAVDSAVGSVCVFGRGLGTSFGQMAKVGDLAMFAGQVKGSNAASMVEGQVLRAKASTSAASGNGSSVQQGAIASTETGYAALHVFSASGNLVVKVESDSATGFPSTTDRITFTTASGPGAQFGSVAGPVTDDWWRISWTLSAGSASFAVVFGIS